MCMDPCSFIVYTSNEPRGHWQGFSIEFYVFEHARQVFVYFLLMSRGNIDFKVHLSFTYRVLFPSNE